MATYSAVNWVLCLTTSLVLGMSIWHDRSLLIRPSVLVVLFFHIMIQWAATVDAQHIYAFLPEPWDFALLAHGFPLMGLLGSLARPRKGQHAVWQRILHPRPLPTRYQSRMVLILAASVVAVVAYYFSVVPVTQTGMHAILFDPERSSIAREESFKLIDDGLLRYGFSFMTGACAPLLAVLLVQRLAGSLRLLRLRQAMVAVFGIMGVLVAVSPTGARGYPASIIMVMLLALLLRRGVPLNPLQILAAAVGVLAVPTVLTVMREGKELQLHVFWDYLREGILQRVLYTPMETGLWHAHYAQTMGYIGISGVPKLAKLMGVPAINVSNVIGLAYALNPLDTISANTCFVFSYYSYFGLLSYPLSLLGLWLLDGALWVYKRLSDHILLACVAAVDAACLSFLSTDYTTVFLSNGLAVILVMAPVLDWLCVRRTRAGMGVPRNMAGRSDAPAG